MTAILGAEIWAPGGPEGLLADLLAGRCRGDLPWIHAEAPSRPRSLSAGAWRRMSRLSRMAATVALPLVARCPDQSALAVVWGSAIGEIAPTSRFLDRLFTEGPAAASPLAFQRSVYNAPVGHLSIALSLTGHTETVAAGGATGLVALSRGLDLIKTGRAAYALVLAGDDLNRTVQRAWELCGAPGPLGECVAGVLLGPGEGPEVVVRSGVHPLPDRPVLARARSLPAEGPLVAIPGAVAPERCLGLSPSMGLTALAALVSTGGSVIDQDDAMLLTARVCR